MRAIETRYKGRLFRSRLEARYAVLFDALRIEWDYEPEGFEFSDGTRYLPDFWLRMRRESPQRKQYPDAGYWIEIKALPPTSAEAHKMSLLCGQTGHHGYVFVGTPGGGSQFFCARTGKWVGNPPWQSIFGLAKSLGWKDPSDRPLPVIPEPSPNWFLRTSILMCCAELSGNEYSSAFDKALERSLSARFEFGGRA